MAKYLVTGIAGFIGSSIGHELVQRGETVRGLDDFSSLHSGGGPAASPSAAARAAIASVDDRVGIPRMLGCPFPAA